MEGGNERNELWMTIKSILKSVAANGRVFQSQMMEGQEAVFRLVAQKENTWRPLRSILDRLVKQDIKRSGLCKGEWVGKPSDFVRIWIETYNRCFGFIHTAACIGRPCYQEALTKHCLSTSVWEVDCESIFSGATLESSCDRFCKKYRKVLLKIARSNKECVITALKDILKRRIWHTNEYALLKDIIKILGNSNMRILEKIEENIVVSLLTEIEREAGRFEIIEVFLEKISPLFPKKFWKKIEFSVISKILSISTRNVPIIQFTYVEDLKHMYSIFRKVKGIALLTEHYLNYLKISESSFDFFEFHSKFILNEDVMRVFSDKRIQREVNKYYAEVLDKEVVIKKTAFYADLCMKIGCLLDKDDNLSSDSTLYDSLEKGLDGEIKSIVRYINANPIYSKVIFRESREVRRVLVPELKRRSTHSEQHLLDSLVKPADDIPVSSSSRSDVENLVAFKKSIIRDISSFFRLSKHPGKLFSALQVHMASRLLLGLSNLSEERTLVLSFPSMYSQKGLQMIDDAESGLRSGMTLMRMCKWPAFLPQEIEILEVPEWEQHFGPLVSAKKVVEAVLRSEGKRVQWVDSLSKVRAKVNGIERVFTLYQYYFILCVIHRIKANETTKDDCIGQIDILIRKGLIIRNGTNYTINNQSQELSFLPSSFEVMTSRKVPQNELHAEAERKSDERKGIVLSEVARIMKNKKTMKMSELMRTVKAESLDDVVQDLVGKGILERKGEDITYIP